MFERLVNRLELAFLSDIRKMCVVEFLTCGSRPGGGCKSELNERCATVCDFLGENISVATVRWLCGAIVSKKEAPELTACVGLPHGRRRRVCCHGCECVRHKLLGHCSWTIDVRAIKCREFCRVRVAPAKARAMLEGGGTGAT